MSSGALPRLAVAIPLAAIVGLLVGSFLNVVIYRTPLGLSVATPRSFCPTCDRTLAWWENIPVGSWVVLGGRCRTCRHPISIRYPLVELATGIAFALVTWAWDGTIISAGYCALAATIIAVGLIEYDGQRAPLSVAAIGTALGQIIIVAGGSWLHLWRLVGGSLAGVALATVVFGLLRRCDPDCLDPRGHGRSALLVAGCWAGGLGLVPAAVGATVWTLAYFLCMVGASTITRHRTGSGDRSRPSMSATHPLLGTPLVTSLTLAMLASLIAVG